MQSQDDRGNIVSAQMLNDLSRVKELSDAIERATELGATQHTIGELPNKGDILEIRGLMYEVKFVDYKRGEVRIKILENYKLTGDGTPVKIRKKDMG